MNNPVVYKSIISFLIRIRLPIILILASLLVLSAQHIINVKLDNSISIWFVKQDSTYESYIEFQKKYGSDEIIIASIPIKFDSLEQYRDDTTILQEQIEGVASVADTYGFFDANYPVITSTGLNDRPLYSENRNKEAQIKLLDQLADFSQQLISSDRKTIFLYVQLKPSESTDKEKSDAVREVITKVRDVFPDALISGPPVLNESYNQSLLFEAVLFGALSFFIIVLLLLILLPRRSFLWIALISVLLPPLYLFGLVGYLEIPLNMISALIPTLLLVYSLTDTVHILNALDRYININANRSRSDLLYDAILYSIVPCSLTTLTTLVGYFALFFSRLPALNSMGILSCLGILIAFFVSYLIIIIGFSFINPSHLVSKNDKSSRKRFFFNFFSEQVIKLSFLSQSQIIVATLVILTITSIGGFFLKVDTDSADLLPKGSVKNQLYDLDRQLGGTFRMQLDLVASENQSILNEDVIKRVEQFTDSLADHKQIGSVLSVVTFIDFFKVRYPQIILQSEQFSTKIEEYFEENKTEKSLFNFVDLDRNTLFVTLTFPNLSASELTILISDINTKFSEVFKELPVKLKINGFASVFAKLNEFVVISQLTSFCVALIIICLFLVIYLRSLKHALIIIIPNLIPITGVLAFMGLFNIDLGVTTAMIAPIILGISIDDTIHLLYHFRELNRKGCSIDQALAHSISYTTPALVTSSLSLCAGFLIIAFSQTPTVSNFGALCMLAVLIALFADLFLLPALIRRFWKT